MSLGDLLEDLKNDQEARTRRERHGSGEITFFNEMPVSAIGCRLPDGSPGACRTMTAVRTVAQRGPLPGAQI
jgi:hypothetical protein